MHDIPSEQNFYIYYLSRKLVAENDSLLNSFPKIIFFYLKISIISLKKNSVENFMPSPFLENSFHPKIFIKMLDLNELAVIYDYIYTFSSDMLFISNLMLILIELDKETLIRGRSKLFKGCCHKIIHHQI